MQSLPNSTLTAGEILGILLVYSHKALYYYFTSLKVNFLVIRLYHSIEDDRIAGIEEYSANRLLDQSVILKHRH